MSETQVARRTMGRLAQILEEEISRAMVTATRAACGRVLLELAREAEVAPAPLALPEAGVALEVGEPPAGQAEVAAAAVAESATPASPEPEPEEEVTKVCRRCGEEKPLTEYYQFQGRHTSTCRDCALAAPIDEYYAGEGVCSSCGNAGHLYLSDGEGSGDLVCYECRKKAQGPGCAVCGAPTPALSNGRYAKYCSKKCQNRFYYERYKARAAQGGGE